ncbi:MAG TPA: vitamin B12-dependent ribonucleotide reductase, partial [Actinomycetes bacterium]|nr:vitamin B12-dependent ribonucleotide reductase [Actinomycetes bacterium]
FEHAVDVVILAQEIVVGPSSYPTEEIGANARAFRQLGMGYANLGALLMANGLAYDSDEGRAICAAITALMTGRAYRTSAEVAGALGPYERYEENRDPHNHVMRKHRHAAYEIDDSQVTDSELLAAARRAWDEAVDVGTRNGYRNAQATVLAPTGTISFLMDCDTTGIEPDFSLVKFKELVGGGQMTIVNQTVPLALETLGYSPEEIEQIEAHLAETATIVGAPGLRDEHLSVFDVAVGERAIAAMGHVKMMAAAQPFLSGAISKTVNLPESVTVEDIADVYTEGWKLGLKALAIYRDNCKVGQPLSDAKGTSRDNGVKAEAEPVAPTIEYRPTRKRLPKNRAGYTTSFAVGGAEGYMTASRYEDDQLGEIFLKMSKQGSTLAGMMDAFSIAISIGLQYGVPLETYVQKFVNMRFDPAGLTDDQDVRMAQSIMDYIFRRLALDYLPYETRSAIGIYTADERARYLETGSYEQTESEDSVAAELETLAQSAPTTEAPTDEEAEVEEPASKSSAITSAHSSTELLEALQGTASDAPMCFTCGTKMRPAGSCYVCEGCGATSGCS